MKEKIINFISIHIKAILDIAISVCFLSLFFIPSTKYKTQIEIFIYILLIFLAKKKMKKKLDKEPSASKGKTFMNIIKVNINIIMIIMFIYAAFVSILVFLPMLYQLYLNIMGL